MPGRGLHPGRADEELPRPDPRLRPARRHRHGAGLRGGHAGGGQLVRAHQRGLIVGLVVGGYGGAAIYISPLAKYLIANFGLSGSFIGLGMLFAVVVIVAGQLLAWPPPGYVPPASPRLDQEGDHDSRRLARLRHAEDLAVLRPGVPVHRLGAVGAAGHRQRHADAEPHGAKLAFFAANAWLLASFGGLVNAAGRIGTGLYSDRIGRPNAYLVNGVVSAVCLFLTPSIMRSGNVLLLFLAVGVAYWQYGGGLSLMPAITADYFGSKNLGFNYGLVFIGWGIAFFVPQLAGYIKDLTGSLDYAFYLSGALLVLAVIVSRFLRRPLKPQESQGLT